MSLREELVRRLMKIHDRLEKPFDVPGGIMTRSRNEVWASVADECIRQMEWARSHCLDGQTLLEEEANGRITAVKFSNDLTLAPEDWKP